MNKLLFISTTIFTLLLSGCSLMQPKTATLDVSTQQELKQEASKAIKTVAGSLQKNLMSKVKEGGLSRAATFCSTHATSLAKEASKTLNKGVSLRRITDKPRNPMSQGTPEQLAVFEEIKNKMTKGEKVDMIVKQKSANHYQVYKPIKMAGACLNCHGDETKRQEKAYEIIAKKYPNDKAVNYKLNDFRGAFLVDIVR